MNPPRNHNDLELLIQLGPHAQPHLDTLTPEEFTQLADIFRLPYPEGLQRLRRILLQVLLIEREHFVAYLQLPKFKPLPPRAISTLQNYWHHLWTAFCAHRQQETKPQPPAQELGVVPNYNVVPVEAPKQTPRMPPYEYYRPYQTYPKFPIDQHKMTFSPFSYYYNFQNYAYANPYHQPPPTNPLAQQQLPQFKYPNGIYREDPQVDPERLEAPAQKSDKLDRGDKGEKGEKAQRLEKTDRVEKTEKLEKNEKNQKKQKADKVDKSERLERPPKIQKTDKNDKSDKVDRIEKSEKSQKAEKQKDEGSMSFSEMKHSKPRKERDSSQNGKEPEPPRSNIVNLRFLHCACMGHAIETSQKSFQCHQCHNFFHFSCLHYATSQPKTCPLCMLIRNHIFTETMPRSIKSGWFQVSNKECFVTKLRLDQDEMGIFRRCMAVLAEKQKLKDKEPLHSIEFRILRINQKSKLKPARKVIKTCFPLIANQLRKIQTRQWIQLKLKQVTEPSLIFYVLTLVRLKDRPKLTQDYLALERKSMPAAAWAGRMVSLLHPLSGRMVQLPVRGQSCDHLQCEDLVYLYQSFQSSAFEANNRLQCSHCKKSYTAHSKFTADLAFYQLLKTRPLTATKVKIEGGKLQWASPEMKESMQEQGQGSGSER